MSSEQQKSTENCNSSPCGETSPQEGEANYGDAPLIQSSKYSTTTYSEVSSIEEGRAGEEVHVRARLQSCRHKGNICFLVLRQQSNTVQVVFSKKENIPPAMLKFIANIPRESVVEVTGVIAKAVVKQTSQHTAEISGIKLFVINRSSPELPMQIEDAARPQPQVESHEFVAVSQDVRLNNRVIDLRTPANNAIFKLQSGVCMLFREQLYQQNFMEIHTPKLMPSSSEGGASVFKVPYFGGNAYLAQSPQLHKQMAICSGFEKVFEIGPVFRAENAQTHRHLCEFVGLDIEMTIKSHYHEILEVVDRLFVGIFEGLEQRFAHELQVVNTQFPYEPLKYLKPTLRINFAEGIEMLRENGYPELAVTDDLTTTQEKALGRLVRERYNTDFFILDRFPTQVRTFYTMPSAEDPRFANAFDIMLRGEEICSGAQRIHEYAMLEKNVKAYGINPSTLEDYLNAFKYGVPPHAGFGVGLERVVMLYLGLGNIRKTSMFPRDPHRLAP